MENRKCNIGFVVGGLYNGGQERQMLNLSVSMKEKGHQVKVIIYNKNDYSELVYNRFIKSQIKCAFLSGSRLSKLRQLRSQLKKVHVAHCFAYYMNFFVWIATRFTRVITIGGLRGDIEQYVEAMGGTKAWLNVAPLGRIISNSYVQGQRLEQKYGFLSPTIKVVRNGYDGDIQYHPLPKANNGKIKIISIGRLVDYKRFDLSLQALYKLKHGFELRIFGEGESRPGIEKMITELGLSESVSLHGEVEDIDQKIREAHLMLHMSDFEGTSNVIMESIANGRPVVCTDVGDNSFLVQDGVTGFVVEPRNVGQASACLTKLSMDFELLSRMSKSATEYAKKNFSVTVYRTNTMKAYQAFGLKVE